jgi:Tfp pilus assembly protein PilX
MRRHRDDDSGVALIIVLLFMLVVSAVVLGLLKLLQTSFDASSAVRAARQTNYAADSATELAISNVVNDRTGDLGGQASPPCSFTLSGIDGTSSTVTCAPYSGSDGALDPRHARNAIQLMSTSADALTLSGNRPLTVDGRIYNHGDISLGSGTGSQSSITSTATMRMEGTGGICTDNGRVMALRGKFCNSSAATSQGLDPGWTASADASTPLADVTKITCDEYKGKKGSGGIVTFPAGRYLVNPSVLVATLGALSVCDNDNSTLYFPPGSYYFQAPFVTSTTSPKHQFDVVAGQASGTWLSGLNPPPQDGTACNNSANGAHFVLGAGGSLVMSDVTNYLTLCSGPASGAQPSIAVYSAAAAGAGTVMSTADKPSVFVYGALYAPKANLSLTMHNRNQTFFVGAIIANKLEIIVNASSTQLNSPFSLPDCSAADPCMTDRRVVFRATIAGSPNTVLTSVVKFDDDFGNTPAKTTKLTQWAVKR